MYIYKYFFSALIDRLGGQLLAIFVKWALIDWGVITVLPLSVDWGVITRLPVGVDWVVIARLPVGVDWGVIARLSVGVGWGIITRLPVIVDWVDITRLPVSVEWRVKTVVAVSIDDIDYLFCTEAKASAAFAATEHATRNAQREQDPYDSLCCLG